MSEPAERTVGRFLRGRGPSRSAGTALWVIIASGTLTVMASAILGPVVNAIGSGLGVSPSLAGLIITTHGIFIVLTSPIAGAVIDRYGPRRPYVLGLGLYGLAGGVGVIIDSFLALLASRAVLGIAVAFVYTSITVLIYNLFEDERKNRVMGLRGSANSLGAAVWPLVGGALGTLSWHLPFSVYLLALPLGVLAFLTVPEPAVASNRTPGSEGGLRGLVDVFGRTPLLVPVYGLYFVANLLLYAIVVHYPPLLADFGIRSSFDISLYLSASALPGERVRISTIGSSDDSTTASSRSRRSVCGLAGSRSRRWPPRGSWRSFRSCSSASGRGLPPRPCCCGSKSWYRRTDRVSSVPTSRCSATSDSSSRRSSSGRSSVRSAFVQSSGPPRSSLAWGSLG